jgi:hypothetical protein
MPSSRASRDLHAVRAGRTNGWLAFRAVGVSLAGAALFWCGRMVARAGQGAALLVGLAAAVVVGALTGSRRHTGS